MSSDFAVQKYQNNQPSTTRNRNYYYESTSGRSYYQKNPDGTTTYIVEKDNPVIEGDPRLVSGQLRPVEPVKHLGPGPEDEPFKNDMAIEPYRQESAIVYHNPLYRD